jgi:hypothetical protein
MKHSSISLTAVAVVGVLGFVLPTNLASAAESTAQQAQSKDGTYIAFECAGSGPELLIVHGGAGDRTRWRPMLPYFTNDFTVCAMDRRAHGRSGDTLPYSLQKEAEDIAAVVQSRGRPVAVLTYMADAVAHIRTSGDSVPDHLLAHTSPVGWEHIAFSGDFLWDRAAALPVGRRPLNLAGGKSAA